MDILNEIIIDGKKDYRCYDELKKLITNNEEFKKLLITGIKEGKISGYSEELWEMISKQNIRVINSFEDVFRDGANIGYCTVAAKQLSYSLDNVYLCGGVLPILKGSTNCADGSHTWISYNGKVIDTTLMLIIDEEYSKKIGYIEENRYNPMHDSVYAAAKDFTRDSSIKR